MNWRKRLAEILARMAEIKGDITEVEANEAPTTEDATRAEALLTEWDTLEAERVDVAAKVDRLDRIASAVTDPAVVERAVPEAPQVQTRQDPFADVDQVVRGLVPPEDMVARALTVIEGGRAAHDDHKARMTELVEADGTGVVAQYIIAAANPAYRSAFTKIMNAGGAGQAYLTAEEGHALQSVQRAALSSTAGNGGYAIPAFSDVSLIYTGTGTSNAVRQLATVKSGVAHDWKGLSSAGITAYFKPEGTAITDGSHTFSQPVITSFQAAAFVQASLEILDDSAVLNDLPRLIGIAKDELEADKFINGTGTGEPVGLSYALTASKVDTTTTGTSAVTTTSGAADFDKLALALANRSQASASVIANRAYFQTLRNTAEAGKGTSFWNDFGKGIPAQVRGYDAYIASHMNGTFSTTGDEVAILGDIAETFYIYDRLGVTLEPTGHISSTATGLPLGVKGFMARWRVGSAVVNLNAAKMLVVK